MRAAPAYLLALLALETAPRPSSAASADPLSSFTKQARQVLPWATPLATVPAPDAAAVASACLNVSGGRAAPPPPPPPCVWSPLQPGAYLPGCASAVNCEHYTDLAAAQAACAAQPACAGLTSQDGGAPPWELRRGPAPSQSPTGEASYLITNRAACAPPPPPPPPCNAFDTRGNLYACPGGRCDCDGGAAWCARGLDVFSADPAVGLGCAGADLYTVAGAPPPADWAAAAARGDLLYAAREPQLCYMPEVGNGYLGTVAGWASLHIGGLFNGACGSTHKATLASPAALTLGGGAALAGSALDLAAGAFLRRWALPGGGAVEQRIWAHRARPHLLVVDFRLLPGSPALAAPLLSAFDPRAVRGGAGDGCSGAFSDDWLWAGPAGAAPQRWDGVGTLASDAGARANVSIALDAPPAALALSAAAPTLRLLAAFAASTDAPGDGAAVAALAAREYAAAAAAGEAQLWAEHAAAWAALLRGGGGVEVAPASADAGDVARALDIAQHANASRYYLYSSIREDAVAGASPGGLAACSYQGAVFMDMYWWMEPPLYFLAPPLAAALLQYRFLSLPAMTRLAALFGYGARGGAMAAWTAAFQGNAFGCCGGAGALEDCLEQHVTGDVAFSALQYWWATGDADWLARVGYPLLAALADFHLARVSPPPPAAAPLPPGAAYHVRGVLPVDEWCVGAGCGCETPGVDDDAQMNGVTKASLLAAAAAARALARDEPRAQLWQAVGDAVVLLFNASGGGHHDQFNSSACPGGWGGSHYSSAAHTVCPEDVNLLGYPLGELLNISDETVRADMALFAPLTCRENAGMTTPMHTIAWARLGERAAAMAEFNRSMHAAAYGPFLVRNEVDKHADMPGGHFDNSHFLTGDGGFLQALLNGWGGLRLAAEGLRLRRPMLPDSVGTLRLRSLAWRGARIELTLRAAGAQLALLSGAPAACLTDAAGGARALAPGGEPADMPDGYAYPALLTLGAC